MRKVKENYNNKLIDRYLLTYIVNEINFITKCFWHSFQSSKSSSNRLVEQECLQLCMSLGAGFRKEYQSPLTLFHFFLSCNKYN